MIGVTVAVALLLSNVCFGTQSEGMENAKIFSKMTRLFLKKGLLHTQQFHSHIFTSEKTHTYK